MTDWRARDERDLRRLLRTDDRWRGSVDEIARWLDRVYVDHASFLRSDGVLLDVAEERLFAIHGRTAGEPLFDLVVAKYHELARASGGAPRAREPRKWVGRLGWFALGYLCAVPSLVLVGYAVKRKVAKPLVVEVKRGFAVPPEDVWSVLSDVRQWPNHDFPEPFDDDAKLEFSESTTGVGAMVRALARSKEKTTKSITAIDPNKSVSYETSGALNVKGVVTVTRAKGGSEVTWKVTQEPSLAQGVFRPEHLRHLWEQGMKRTLRHLELELRCAR